MATAWDQLVEKLLTQESSEEMVELRKMLLRWRQRRSSSRLGYLLPVISPR